MNTDTETPGPDIKPAGEFEGQKSGRETFEEGRDINRPPETEGPGKKAKFCHLNPGVVCRGETCSVICNRHPWHIEFMRGNIHDEKHFYAIASPIKPRPPR